MCVCVMWFNDTSALVGHFVSSLEKWRRETEDIIEEIEERDRGERKNGSGETEEIKTSPVPLTATRIAGLAQL